MPAVNIPKDWSPQQATAVTEFLSTLLGEIEYFYQDPLIDLVDADFDPRHQIKHSSPSPIEEDDFSEDLPF